MSAYSERKWKEKLTEWNFDKNISATDMNVLVAKAEKRLHEEGKETVFCIGTSQITRERIAQFKRRKVTKETQTVSPEASEWKSSRIYIFFSSNYLDRYAKKYYLPHSSARSSGVVSSRN